MPWEHAVWHVPLSRPPAPLRIWGRAAHGKTGIERWNVPFWALNLYQGSGELRVRGQVFPIRPGFASLTPPDTPFEYRYSGSAILTWAHFTTDPEATTVPIAVMQDLGNRFETVRIGVIEAGMVCEENPVRASARLWDLLWTLSAPIAPPREADPTSLGLHPGLHAALSYIEANLRSDLSVEYICRQAGLSQAHLYRLCRAFTGTSTSGYIRRLRMERALRLLRSTRMSMGEIGAEVGIPDPHAFNKAIRRAYGRSPSELRQGQAPRGGSASPSDAGLAD